MGTTFWGIHILSNEKIELPPYEFKSFSDGWQTCITDFSGIDSASKTAKLFSKQICKPILYYYISDSDYIYFEFFQDGKCISRYCDGGFSNNKNLYGIPSVLEYGAVCYASFNDKAPTAYANKKMKLPNNFYPWGFDTKNRLILSGNGKIYIVDDNFSIIAKVSLKGDCEDIVGDFILSATESSFYAYAYDPKAKVRIYQLIDK